MKTKATAVKSLGRSVEMLQQTTTTSSATPQSPPDMFSLVTALVSPHTIEALRARKETLANTLTDSANVVCFQPSEGVCLLQGEWENIKKAYSILEDLYLRTQAEAMVREMLRGSDTSMYPDGKSSTCNSTAAVQNSLLSSIFSSSTVGAPRSNTSTMDINDSSRMLSGKSMSTSGLSWGDNGRVNERTGKRTRRNDSDEGELLDRDCSDGGLMYDDDDDGPPVLSRVNINGLDTSPTGTSSDDDKSSNTVAEVENEDCDRISDGKHGVPIVSISPQKDLFRTAPQQELPSYPASNGLFRSNMSPLNPTGPHSLDTSLLVAENQIAAMEKALLGRSSSTEMDTIVKDVGGFTGTNLQRSAGHLGTVSGMGGGMGPQLGVDSLSASQPLPSISQSLGLGQQAALGVNQTSLALSQRVVNAAAAAAALRTQQYLNEAAAATTGGRRLPQFSSLFLGGANAVASSVASGATSWGQYAAADLYSMHLSALQHSMQIKQEAGNNASNSTAAVLTGSAAPNEGMGNLLDPDMLRDNSMAPRNDSLVDEELKKVAAGFGYRGVEEFESGHSSLLPLGSGLSAGNGSMQEMRCTRCDKTYKSEARMKEHMRTHDRDYVPVLHTCPKCGKSFTYRHNMVVHLRRFHYGWQPAKRHACRICGVKFQKPYLLRLHEHKTHMIRGDDSGLLGAADGDSVIANSFE